MTVTVAAPPLSRVRTFLFGGFELASLTVSTLAAVSHLTALATATWFASAHSRSTSPVLIPFVPLLVGWLMYAAVGRTRGDL